MKKILAVSLLAAIGAAAQAQGITPTFTTFGTLSGATFGGTGIPNNAVAITTSVPNLTMGLTAHTRFGDATPLTTNNGAGAFVTGAGTDSNAPSPVDPYAEWNFGWYLGGSGVASYNYRLYYDFDPAVGNAATTHGFLTIPGASLPGGAPGPYQDSWNLGMNFLATAAPGVTLPTPGTFDPNAVGTYTFSLRAYATTDVAFASPLGESAISVTAVPEPSAVLLAIAGLGLVGVASRRRRMPRS